MMRLRRNGAKNRVPQRAPTRPNIPQNKAPQKKRKGRKKYLTCARPRAIEGAVNNGSDRGALKSGAKKIEKSC